MHVFIKKIIFNDRLVSMAGALFFMFWIGQRFYFSYQPTILWWLITFQFSLFVLAYLTRKKATEHADGVMEVVFPFVCAAMPFALDAYPFKPAGATIAPVPVFLGFMLAGTLMIVMGVAFLRRSFSIMAEVREPVYRGIYRFCRHPMYLGSMLASMGVVLYSFSYLNLLIFCAFCAMQYYRSTLEEKKIIAVFPGYAEYAAHVGWFWIIGRKKRKIGEEGLANG